jgi:hypothetical protein
MLVLAENIGCACFQISIPLSNDIACPLVPHYKSFYQAPLFQYEKAWLMDFAMKSFQCKTSSKINVASQAGARADVA